MESGDITELLRALSRYLHADLSIGNEAADEIERLREENERLRALLRTARSDTLDQVLRGLRSENDSVQLRAIIAAVEALK